MKLKGRYRRGRRHGIAELMAALLMLAITLVAGTAAFGFVISESNNSSNAVGNAAANNINFLNERFTLVNEQFAGCTGVSPSRTCPTVNFWLYNNGQVAFTLNSVVIESVPSSSNFLNIVFNSTGYTEYGTTGISVCSGSPGISPSSSTLPVHTLSTAPYSVTVPTPGGLCTSNLFAGESYTITLLGLYGSTAQTTVNATG